MLPRREKTSSNKRALIDGQVSPVQDGRHSYIHINQQEEEDDSNSVTVMDNLLKSAAAAESHPQHTASNMSVSKISPETQILQKISKHPDFF